MVESKQQLEELLRDPGYSRTVTLLTKEVMSSWNLAHDPAHSIVLSAIGDPPALALIYRAWILARAGEKPHLPMLISRRRVLDLLRKDARRPGHSSLPTTVEELEADKTFSLLYSAQDRDPQSELENQEFCSLMRCALASFARQGPAQERQAQLLERYIVDDASYSDLSIELGCTKNALRGRVHAAIQALKKHIRLCHRGLLSLRSTSDRARNV